MDTNLFRDKQTMPSKADLGKAIGIKLKYWEEIVSFVHAEYPAGKDEWNFPGVKYGWSFRIKDKKRAIVYMIPRPGYFLAALVFGQKAVDDIMQSSIDQSLKDELAAATPYAEGRGIRIPIKNAKQLTDIKTLIRIKLSH